MFDVAYSDWQRDPNPNTLGKVVKALEPAVQQNLHRMGAAGDPLLASQGRLVAAQAVKTWDPASTATLPSWVGSQMVRINRFRRNNTHAIHIPEGVQLDAMKVENARREFVDKHDREPDQIELADFVHMPLKRLRTVQTAMRPTPSDSVFESGIMGHTTDYQQEAMDMLYQDADQADRAILEGRVGYNGAPLKSSIELMKKTKMNPVQIAKRVMRLTHRLQGLTQDLERVYAK